MKSYRRTQQLGENRDKNRLEAAVLRERPEAEKAGAVSKISYNKNHKLVMNKIKPLKKTSKLKKEMNFSKLRTNKNEKEEGRREPKLKKLAHQPQQKSRRKLVKQNKLTSSNHQVI